jgi:small subunit ribosomal protein S5
MVKTAAVNSEQAPKGDGLIEKRVVIKRVAKVTKRGRRFGFAGMVVVGDGNGRLGVGTGKSKEVPSCILKATENGRKSMMHFKLPLTHPIVAQYGATKIFIQPASEGTGIIAGKTMRAIFEVMGVKNVLSKVFGSSNPINVVRATVKAFQEMAIPEEIAEKRGKTLKEILGVRDE